MADDKMKRDDRQQNVGGMGNKDTDHQSRGRNPQDDQSTGQRSRSDSHMRHGDTGNEGRGGREEDDDI